MDKPKVLFTTHLDKSSISGLDNFDFDIIPFIEISQKFELINLFGFLKEYRPGVIVLSSKNSLQAYRNILEQEAFSHQLVVISNKLADSISEKSDSEIHVAEEANSESIADLIKEKFSTENILHLNGNLRSQELVKQLWAENISAKNYSVYETTFLKPEINVSNYHSVVFMSYSAIDSFFSENALSSEQKAFTIGAKTSKYLSEKWKGEIIQSQNGRIEDLIEIIEKYYASYNV